MELNVKLIIAFILIVFACCTRGSSIRFKRLINGRRAESVVGYYARILYKSEKFEHSKMCGGVIISPKAVLTHGTCFPDEHVEPSIYHVYVGALDWAGNKYKDFDRVAFENSHRNSSAILFRAVEMEFNENVFAAKLSNRVIGGGEELTIYGYGYHELYQNEYSAFLRIAKMLSATEEQCQWDGETETEKKVLNGKEMCMYTTADMGDVGFCNGDEGSPILDKDGFVVGIVSYIYLNCKTTDASIGLRMSVIYDWIQAQLNSQ